MIIKIGTIKILNGNLVQVNYNSENNRVVFEGVDFSFIGQQYPDFKIAHADIVRIYAGDFYNFEPASRSVRTAPQHIPMDDERVTKILTEWSKKSKADWVDDTTDPYEVQLDGNFTPDELEAIAWCKRQDFSIFNFISEDEDV